MAIRLSIPFIRFLLVWVIILPSCSSLLNPNYTDEELQEARLPDQIYFEDSLNVFFAKHVNPFPEKDLMWFTVQIAGEVEMRVSSMESDSVEAIYHFSPQEKPLYTMAGKLEETRLVKCVLFVDGRQKCALVSPAWYPLPQFWMTRYTIEIP